MTKAKKKRSEREILPQWTIPNVTATVFDHLDVPPHRIHLLLLVFLFFSSLLLFLLSLSIFSSSSLSITLSFSSPLPFLHHHVRHHSPHYQGYVSPPSTTITTTPPRLDAIHGEILTNSILAFQSFNSPKSHYVSLRMTPTNSPQMAGSPNSPTCGPARP